MHGKGPPLPDSLDELAAMLRASIDRDEQDAILRAMRPAIERIRRKAGRVRFLASYCLEAFVGDSMGRCFEVRQSYDPRRPFGAWWAAICHNDAISEARRNNTRAAGIARYAASGCAKVSVPGIDSEQVDSGPRSRLELSPADIGRVEQWTPDVRVRLLCLAGLWDNVPTADWRRWCDAIGLPPGFPCDGLDLCADRRLRRDKLCELLGVTKDVLNHCWSRNRWKLDELDVARQVRSLGSGDIDP